MHIYFNMGVKEALGPQECSQPFQTSYKIVFRANNRNILFSDFSFVFFRISFVYIARKVTSRGSTSRRVPEVSPISLKMGEPGEWDKLASDIC